MRPNGQRALLAFVFVVGAALALPAVARAQSPELSLRELASGQIKKGVRSIGFGGDGATYGNYALVYRDQGSALVDAGVTGYTNGNLFSFTAVGVTTPPLWNGLAIYAIALSQWASGVRFALHTPAFGPTAVPVRGEGSNQAVFVKAAMPLGRAWALGLLLSYERSQFDTFRDDGTPGVARFQNEWRPSGGIGLTWEPVEWLLAGARVILNHDWERRIDDLGTHEGLVQSYEVRYGVAVKPWPGAILDAGITMRWRRGELANPATAVGIAPNLGIEQTLFDRHFGLRAGLDESSFGAGVTVRFAPVRVDAVYVYGLGLARIGDLFGAESHSVLVTLTYDYLPPAAPPRRAH